MNTCGFEHHLSEPFLEGDDPFEVAKEYYFSEWYPIVKDYIYTPVSYICTYEELMNGKVDEIIQALPGKRCFARLDTLSSKPTSPYFHSSDIIHDLQQSERTKYYYTATMPIIIREYLDLRSFEFRCFVHDNKLRGISTEGSLSVENIEEIKRVIQYMTIATEFVG